ncbi:MAG: 16S rRNA (cytosine(1402)-N(4))-methyltransferase, partial [Gemmatimonadales bacterium]
MKQYHIPVLVGEVSILAAGSRRAVDCTVGGGGHAAVLCQAGAEVLAVDRDEEAIQAARQWLGAGLKFLHGSFGDSQVLQQIGQFKPDFI